MEKKTIFLEILIFFTFLIFLIFKFNNLKIDGLYLKISPKINIEKMDIKKEEKVDSIKNDVIGKIIFNNDISIDIYNLNNNDVLNKGVGKINNNSILNKNGNNIILGHNDTYFKYLENLDIDSKFEIKTDVSLKYKVINTYITNEDDYEPYKNSDSLKLTLITCYPFNYPFRTSKRYVVEALEITN